MQDARGMKRAEKADRLEAKQCTICHRWFTVRRASRSTCFKCEEGGQGTCRQ